MSSEADALRKLPLSTVISWLGFPMEQFKRRPRKAEWFGKCIFHDPKSNETSFSFTDEVFHCFSCKAKGRGAIDIVMAKHFYTYTRAVDWLKERAGSLPTASILPQDAPKTAKPTAEARTENAPFRGVYEKSYQWPCEWLENRIPRATLDLFGVGLYHNPSRKSPYDGKVMLPIRRHSDGEKTGYLARTIAPIDGQPKYVFPKLFLKSAEVYGAWELSQAHQLPIRVAYLLESPFAVMKFHSLGLPAVSCFGWSISQMQADILAKLAKGWVYLPDRNKYHDVHSCLHLLAQRCWVRLPELPPTVNDPEALTESQIKAL